MATHPLTAATITLSPARIAALAAGAAGGAAAALALWAAGSVPIAAGFLAAALIGGVGVLLWRRLAVAAPSGTEAPDWGLARALVDCSDDAVAVTDRAGRLVCANAAYEQLFDALPGPPNLPLAAEAVGRLAQAGRAAWRDGAAETILEEASGRSLAARVMRAGAGDELLLWRFVTAVERDAAAIVHRWLSFRDIDRLGAAGVMAALVTGDGHIIAANPRLATRVSRDGSGTLVGRDLTAMLAPRADGFVCLVADGPDAAALRLVEVPVGGPQQAIFVLLIDVPVAAEGDAAGVAGAAASINSLVSLIPFGMALVDREGRFLQMNKAFRNAAGIAPDDTPLYPGDLLVREDKTPVADAIRRFAGGAAHTTDIAVRLKHHPEEPVALTIAGARGMGEAAVLLSLKDNSEESRLKREVAQATKMQAVGQLAGGVAHDFNNILTAILGHSDLMLMRHSPGDSDYDDIQQIRTNSNRAAGLTRQLLAFSRQQTLRPQILQLPDVVSEVSNLLKRLMGETVRLDVSHGRGLGPIRADPGQLEQVVVNLAVNARDAIVQANPRGGGVLTIRTEAASAAQVRAMASDILPVADYTRLTVTDNGTGIPPEVLPKIFEPFFTTKETGKGTGLGLSTVYGIVKQSGGWIFADPAPGHHGASFSIYFPVHAAGSAPRLQVPRGAPKPVDTWGTGTILLVEDEAMVRAVAERALTRQGYSVISAENGEAALTLLETSGRPDLLISDVVMPAMDGPTMVRRARERYPDLPILFMSGYAEEQLRRSIDLDGVAFLAKPFSVQQLAEATRDILHPRGSDAKR